MTRPYYSVKHVESLSDIPQNLTRGRAYFVDDEQVIVIDHGQGPITYGGKPGPQGQAGEPLPQLQEQLDDNAAASLTTSKTIWGFHKDYKANIQRLDDNASALAKSLDNKASIVAGQADDKFEFVKALTDKNAEAILLLINEVQTKFNEYDSGMAIIAKSIANLYPESFNQGGENNEDPLDGETLSTDAGTWTIQQTILKDGSIVLNLTAKTLSIENITIGDSVDFDQSTWRITGASQNEDGSVSITLDQ